MANIENIPVPPLEMRKLVGPTKIEDFDNANHELVFPNVPTSKYDFVFDFGCGCGRTARQLIQQNPIPKQYIGIDLHRGMIEWCKRNLTPYANNFEFHHQDVYNIGINPDGKNKVSRFPVENESVTLFIAVSVFTHITEAAALFYLEELFRILHPNGVAVTTWFLFDKSNFPMMQEFQNTLFINDLDPTNAVIFDREWLLNNCDRIGLRLSRIEPPKIRGFQWIIYIEKNKSGNTHVNFPEDNAPKGINRPPLRVENADKIGLNFSK